MRREPRGGRVDTTPLSLSLSGVAGLPTQTDNPQKPYSLTVTSRTIMAMIATGLANRRIYYY